MSSSFPYPFIMSNESAITWSPYTQHPEMSASVVFPDHGMQIFSQVLFSLGLSVLAYCFARRTVRENWTWKGVTTIPWARLCLIMIFVDSWIFLFCSSLLIYGAGLSYSDVTCTLAVFTCITCYLISKLLIYSFLIEKVYIVWSSYSYGTKSRMATPIWRFCVAIMVPLGGIFVLLIWGRYAELRDDHACVIGLNRVSSITLLGYDLFLTTVFTGLFVWPLWTHRVSKELRQVASRTLIASIAALTTSGINVAVLTTMRHQLGWVCLSSCGADVTFNAIVLYLVTKGTIRPKESVTSGQVHSGGMTPSANRKDLRLSTRPVISTPSNQNGGLHTTSGGNGYVDHVLERAHCERATHFAASPQTRSRPAGDVRMDDMRKSAGVTTPGVVTKLVDRMRNIASVKETNEAEEHSMSVQVTVTTDIQLDQDTLDEDKYAGSTSTIENIRELEAKPKPFHPSS